LGEVGRRRNEMIDSMAVGRFKQPCVFGCSFGWELERCAISVLDSTFVALVEASISLVVSPSSSITRGLSEVCQRESRLLIRNAPSTLTLTIVDLTKLV